MIGMHAVDIVQPDVMYMAGYRGHFSREYGGCGRHALHAARANLLGHALHDAPAGRHPERREYVELHRGFGLLPWQDGLFSEDPLRVKDAA